MVWCFRAFSILPGQFGFRLQDVEGLGFLGLRVGFD